MSTLVFLEELWLNDHQINELYIFVDGVSAIGMKVYC